MGIKNWLMNTKIADRLYWTKTFNVQDRSKKSLLSRFVEGKYFQHCYRKYHSHYNCSIADLYGVLEKISLYEKCQTVMKDQTHTILFKENEFRFFLPNVFTDTVQREIFRLDSFFEQDLLVNVSKYIEAGSTIADIGCNIGNHTIFFSKVCRARKVYSFEPLMHNFKIFEKNLYLNEVDNVEKHSVALGSKKGRANIAYFNISGLGSTQFREEDDGEYDVITLDSIDIDKLDFCKIDVEGAQYEVLLGALETLKKFKPMIWIELLDKESNSANYNEKKELVLPKKLLKDNGYVILQRISPIDYLYVHKEKLDAALVKAKGHI